MRIILLLINLYYIYCYKSNNIENNLIPLWWNIGKESLYNKNILNKITINNNNYCLYYDNNIWKLISDVCIHRGASLSAGKILKKKDWIRDNEVPSKLYKNNKSNKIKDENKEVSKCIQCPYHGWEFSDGYLSKIPGIINNNFNMGVARHPIKLLNNDIYTLFSFEINSNNGTFPNNYNLYEPDEEKDNNFEMISQSIKLDVPCEIIIENILDMMHISYVHSFGNSIQPIPYGIKFVKYNDYHGKTTYFYKSGATSLSRWLGFADEVIVENEYYLPSTTITRIIANKITKTIITYSYPINENKSILYLKLYRNYFKGYIGDLFHHKQLDITLKEDISILKKINYKYYKGLINTKFDITQNERRKAIKSLYNDKYKI
jgi:phenylpropionate dioxygenase-like ring-hydroxylating dioxygenase large terminal subunit